MTTDNEKSSEISFFQGGELIGPAENDNQEENLNVIKQKISDLMNMKSINFLLGAGTSSTAIPPMKEMKEKVDEEIEGLDNNARDRSLKSLYGKLSSGTENLEKILGALYSKRAYQEAIGSRDGVAEEVIKIIEETIFEEINVNMSAAASQETLDIYKRFYQKIGLRGRDLDRACVFTTNNDLMSEISLDYLNINYNDGFGGGVKKYFNPARFFYTYSRKIDDAYEKYEPIQPMVYLFKLHGSINWVEGEENVFFNITQIDLDCHGGPPDNNVLIYPNPLKQNISLGSPYADLIREFQNKLLKPHSALFIIGYSFSDEHINNAIYQALASNSSLSVVVFGNYPDAPICKSLDKRIYNLYGEITKEGGGKEKIHYFKYIVEEIIPDQDQNKDQDLLRRFMDFIESAKRGEGVGDDNR
ncbi:SIR2 family protein [Alloalcanivorax marinus]|uniref:SIR2 family protein n=1 Tax=Alloalcanivorax marinus TaxID=1177169 RepID=UPI00195C9FED|nr:SIR2 family protein [Alloalcanivorax marinus]MBM7332894.1 SIR2 family protein [Alloalcanivorax marinus]